MTNKRGINDNQMKAHQKSLFVVVWHLMCQQSIEIKRLLYFFRRSEEAKLINDESTHIER